MIMRYLKIKSYRLIRNIEKRTYSTETWLEREIEAGERKVLVVSLHKNGTHLIKKVLELAGLTCGAEVGGYSYSLLDFVDLKSNEFLLAHRLPDSVRVRALIEKGKILAILNFRDPRDACVSRFNNARPCNLKNSIDPVREFTRKVYENYFKSDNEFLEYIIKGDGALMPAQVGTLADSYRLARGFLAHPLVHKTRFEDLIGAKGGGKRDVQIETIRKLFEFLNIKVDPEIIATKAFDPGSRTFHKGQIGAYKEVFTQEQIEMFNQYNGDILRDFGYE